MIIDIIDTARFGSIEDQSRSKQQAIIILKQPLRQIVILVFIALVFFPREHHRPQHSKNHPSSILDHNKYRLHPNPKMYDTEDTLASEEADELRSLSTMDTLTFRRLRAQRKKSKESDDDESVKNHTRDSMRRGNTIPRGSRDDEQSAGDTLTTLTNASSRRSRRGNNVRGRNSRGEAAAAGTGRRCIIDICLLSVLGVVLLAKFGSVELQLQSNMSKLRGGDVSSNRHTTDGGAYAEWLLQQSKYMAYASGEDAKRVRLNNNHDAAEEFFDQAIHNLKNGLPLPQVPKNDTSSSETNGDGGSLEQSRDGQMQINSQQQQPIGQLTHNSQSLGGIKSQYENAQPAALMDTPSQTDTQQLSPQDGTMQRDPEFQSFEQAQIQHQLQQAIVKQQQQLAMGQTWQQQEKQLGGSDPLPPQNILDDNQQQLNQLIAEASDHGEDGFKLNAQHLTENNGAKSFDSMAQNQNKAFLMDPANQPLMQQPTAAIQMGAAAAGVADQNVAASNGLVSKLDKHSTLIQRT
jgi:hypothetical protein